MYNLICLTKPSQVSMCQPTKKKSIIQTVKKLSNENGKFCNLSILKKYIFLIYKVRCIFFNILIIPL